MKSFAIENVKKYQHRQNVELLKTISYHFAEALTLIGIIVVGIAMMTIL